MIGDAFVQQARRLHGARQAAAAAGEAPRHEPQRRRSTGRSASCWPSARCWSRGTPVRLAGQDSRRGTFVQRHSVLHDRANGQEWIPLTNLSDEQGQFWVYDSLLSEYAALAFEYGYSVERADALVLWEAQFGDFVERRAVRHRRVHLVRRAEVGPAVERRAAAPPRLRGPGPRPLVGPHRALPADVRAGQHDRRAPVDARVVLPPAAPPGLRPPAAPADRLHSEGDAAAARRDQPGRGVPDGQVRAGAGRRPRPRHERRQAGAAARRQDPLGSEGRAREEPEPRDRPRAPRAVLPGADRASSTRCIDSYPNAELFWVQDEPENQGAWPFIALEVVKHLHGRTIKRVSRAAAASTATGSPKVHALEQAAIMKKALTL